MKKQEKTPAAEPPTAPDDDAVIPEDLTESPTHTEVTSPKAEQLNDRMKLASEPNDGQPLAHRNRNRPGRRD